MRNIIGIPQKQKFEANLFESTPIFRNRDSKWGPSEHCIGNFPAETAQILAKQLRKEGFSVKCKARGPRKIHKDVIHSCYNTATTCNFDLPLKFATRIALYVYEHDSYYTQ
jgi:hypothetical protein